MWQFWAMLVKLWSLSKPLERELGEHSKRVEELNIESWVDDEGYPSELHRVRGHTWRDRVVVWRAKLLHTFDETRRNRSSSVKPISWPSKEEHTPIHKLSAIHKLRFTKTKTPESQTKWTDSPTTIHQPNNPIHQPKSPIHKLIRTDSPTKSNRFTN